MSGILQRFRECTRLRRFGDLLSVVWKVTLKTLPYTPSKFTKAPAVETTELLTTADVAVLEVLLQRSEQVAIAQVALGLPRHREERGEACAHAALRRLTRDACGPGGLPSYSRAIEKRAVGHCHAVCDACLGSFRVYSGFSGAVQRRHDHATSPSPIAPKPPYAAPQTP